jgi:FtsP/CotA-like multicopper oxidase with cupredoxin domain
MNRQDFDDVNYVALAYDPAFPVGAVIDGYGPPNNYNMLNADGAIGGNPAVSTYLIGAIQPPLPQENGWKDTILAYPGQVTRIISRWAPQDVAVNAVSPGQNRFGFDPTYGPGYVWHCHIIDHEDNEMMRPYIPTKRPDNTFARASGQIPSVELLLILEP